MNFSPTVTMTDSIANTNNLYAPRISPIAVRSTKNIPCVIRIAIAKKPGLDNFSKGSE